MTYQTKAGSVAIVIAGVSLALAACSGSTIHKRSSLGDVQTLSLDAKQRLVVTGKNPEGNRILCAEPSPDALVAQAAVLSASGAYNAGANGPSGSGGAGGGFQESAASIGYRTQSLQVLRDGYYRLCETYMNGAISDQEYKEVISNLDTFIVVALAVDGLGNSKSAANVAIGTGAVSFKTQTTGTGGTNAEGEIDAAPKAEFSQPSQTTTITDKSAVAVAQIVRDFLNYKEDYNCVKYLHRQCRRIPNSNIPNPK